MIRDGGSLAACFLGTNGAEYWLFFSLLSEKSEAGEFVRLGYKSPVIFERAKFQTSNEIGWESMNQVVLSWKHAEVFLHQLRDHVRNDGDLKWLNAMEEVACSQGGLPKCLEAR